MTKPGAYVSPIRLKCVSCERTLPGNFFRGNRYKAVACKECESSHQGLRWCVDCASWLPEGDFYRTGPKQKFLTTRCKPCRTFQSHGITRKFMEELTGSAIASCGACGDSGARLSIDHDHRHCVGELGCRHCVRGYLCQACNTAEGLLKTSQRARALADYMDRTAMTDEDLASLPASERRGVQRNRRVEGANRTYYSHD